MAKLLEDYRITAIVGLNDMLAREYLMWCEGAGVTVPASVSIISYDNTMIARVFNITSIDFGYDHLGYAAAHRFIGDITVNQESDRGVFGEARLVQRGSVGKAAR
jgi:DNA-binding LacI/PurR family transcriptional regulator